MTASEIAAWWGAVIATLVLVWDVVKWKKRTSSVRVKVSPDMSSFNQHEGRFEDDKSIFVEVVNQSEQPITITHLVLYHYSSMWHVLRRKPEMQGAVPRPGGAQPIPYELEPGKRWVGLIDQKDVEEKTGVKGVLYCGVYHTASNKPALAKTSLR